MSATITLRVDDSVKSRLDDLGADARGTAEHFTAAMLAYALDHPEDSSDLIELLQASESGDYVTDADMKVWLASWGSESELPPPRLVSQK